MLRVDWGDERGMLLFGGYVVKNWLFLRIFLFFIGDWIDMESWEWKVFEKLFVICVVFVLIVIYVESVVYLKILIRDFLFEFK